MRLRTNDPVIVTKGRDRGKRGRISRVDLKHGTAVVEGINIVSRHQRPTGAFRQGGIIQKELPIPVSNLAYFDERTTRLRRSDIGFWQMAARREYRRSQVK